MIISWYFKSILVEVLNCKLLFQPTVGSSMPVKSRESSILRDLENTDQGNIMDSQGPFPGFLTKEGILGELGLHTSLSFHYQFYEYSLPEFPNKTYWSECRCAGGLAAANVVATIFGIFLLFFLFSSFLSDVAKTP